MFNKEKFKFFCKLIIILAIIIFLITCISTTLSKYISVGQSNSQIDVAYYLLNEDSISQTLNVGEILPRTIPYEYYFTIANNDGNHRSETTLEYDLTIKTTTNLPLVYSLYLNQEYTDIGATNIISTNVVEQDSDGTYFRTITVPKTILNYNEDITNEYQLIIEFPAIYDSAIYQNIIEDIEILIESRQVTQE